MADRRSINQGIRLDIEQLQLEARHRWLRPAEICEILRNYQKFQISSEPPNRPPSGSLFLFDRKVLRYFRKDGHNWRKKKDGKTVKEAHEKLKVGSVDVLHCYYAHGEQNESFQRRSYWLLEEDHSHIVFVHYLEVKGTRNCIREPETVLSNTQISNSLCSSYSTSHGETFTGNTGSPSMNSTLTSSYEEAESENNHQAVSRLPILPDFSHTGGGLLDDVAASLMHSGEYKGDQLQIPGLVYGLHAHVESTSHAESTSYDSAQPGILDMATWQEYLEQCGTVSSTDMPYYIANLVGNTGNTSDGNRNFSQLLDGAITANSGFVGGQIETDWQKNVPLGPSSTEIEGDPCGEGNSNNINLTASQPRLANLCREEGLQKVDSFSKWVSKELAGNDDLHLESSSNISWCNIENGNAVDDSSLTNQLQLDNYSMSPSISQDQLFSILDFSPSWSYADHQTKVLITGRFLKSQEEVSKYSWSCMFGEIEVPAEIFGDGILCCLAPPLAVGQVPFYVTCSNRLACSEVREFEYRGSQNVDTTETRGNINEQHLHNRLELLLSSRSVGDGNLPADDVDSKREKISKIASLMDDELYKASDTSLTTKSLKEKLFSWLCEKVNEDGKGPNVLDSEGQGVLHLAAALGYDWVIQPTLAAGVNVNFRDANGWTALHWAAFCGKEMTVPLLILLGAAPGALTDPSPEVPWGRTPADLASSKGYKGISGFLAESSLTSHLATLTMSERNVEGLVEESITKAVQTISERTATPGFEGDASDTLSMRDSLAAVCNATQAAGRIHQVFRMQSFQRKQKGGCDGDDAGMTDEHILSLASRKIQKSGQYDEKAHSAATSIQKKYRGWKKRKEFLVIRQRVVKIQAHVRGHQVRKRYRTVVWSVGILEKVILRWRRKGTGLRGFRPDAAPNKEPKKLDVPAEDDYDFLKEGRKKTEERLQKALVRVKSMVQYPEGRAQYRRLLTAVEDLQRNQQVCNSILSNSEGTSADGEENMFDVEQFLDDDTFMAITFE